MVECQMVGGNGANQLKRGQVVDRFREEPVSFVSACVSIVRSGFGMSPFSAMLPWKEHRSYIYSY